ncbi:MAG TPA: molybdopterin-binding protein, partial [Candidatus Limnocylindrales bacterium]
MRVERIEPGRPVPARLIGAVLTRDVAVAGARWSKGRRLSAADLEMLASSEAGDATVRAGLAATGAAGFSVLVLDPDDVHEDEAGRRLARAVAGANLTLRGPVQSRVDLVATTAGVARIATAALERIDRIDPLEVFTVFDGQVVQPGDLVASVKIAPHAVPESTLARAEALAARAGPLVTVAPFLRRRVGIVVKESVPSAARQRFERTIRSKVESLGSTIVSIAYVDDTPDAIGAALAALVRDPESADLILTAGAASTDPSDSVFVAIHALGGRVVRRGVPAHPGSMLWLARLRHSAILGLPTCGAYSKATAADLLLPRLLAGEPPTLATVARLGHGGILSRDMRFRFPP